MFFHSKNNSLFTQNIPRSLYENICSFLTSHPLYLLQQKIVKIQKIYIIIPVNMSSYKNIPNKKITLFKQCYLLPTCLVMSDNTISPGENFLFRSTVICKAPSSTFFNCRLRLVWLELLLRALYMLDILLSLLMKQVLFFPFTK